MGKVARGVKCSVIGCEKLAVRSLSNERVSNAGLKVDGAGRGRAYLCKDHYKEFKKETKKEKMLEQWRYRG